MKERPILFSGPMVTAILEGQKTQTRRVIKPQPAAGVRSSVFVASGLEDSHGNELCCPYGQPGDRLWVRETHTFATTDGESYVEVHYRDETTRQCECGMNAAEMASLWIENREEGGDGGDNWRPPIHMPRWASRITLEIISVRVQRLQDITEEDATAEGMTVVPVGTATWNNRQSFATLWDKINGKREGCAWKNNPWVWVVEFKPL